MGARLINRRGLKLFRKVHSPAKNKDPIAPHVCGRAKVIATNGNIWTIQCRTGCSKTQLIDIQSPGGKEWLIATGRAKKLDGGK